MGYFLHGMKNSLETKNVPKFGYQNFSMHSDLKSFYQGLPTQFILTSEEEEILRHLPKPIWSLIYTWTPHHYKVMGEGVYLDYHKVLRSVSQRVIQQTLIDIGYCLDVEHPVIHYRLGDVPFCRHDTHHINKYAYFLWALEKVKSSGIDTSTIIVVSSNKHNANARIMQYSDLYLDDFVSFLNEHGYHTVIQSNSMLYDFATMVFAPAVIVTSSSFSFMGGIASSGIFLSPRLGQETGRSLFSFKNCDWMCPFDPILHSEIRDYYDTETVFKKLRG